MQQICSCFILFLIALTDAAQKHPGDVWGSTGAFLAPVSEILLSPEQVLSVCCISKPWWVVAAVLCIDRKRGPSLASREAARESL